MMMVIMMVMVMVLMAMMVMVLAMMVVIVMAMVMMVIMMVMVMVLMVIVLMTVSTTRHLDSRADLIRRCHHRHHHLQLPCPWRQNGRSQYLRLLLSFFIIIAFNCILVNPEVTSLYFREIS